MPKDLKEIKNFGQGVMFTPTEEDIHEDSAAFSLNIDSASQDGKLSTIFTDEVIKSLNDTFENRTSSALISNATPGDTTLYVDDITAFSNITDNDILVKGIQGKYEHLKYDTISFTKTAFAVFSGGARYFKPVILSGTLAHSDVGTEEGNFTNTAITPSQTNNFALAVLSSTTMTSGGTLNDITDTNDQISIGDYIQLREHGSASASFDSGEILRIEEVINLNAGTDTNIDYIVVSRNHFNSGRNSYPIGDGSDVNSALRMTTMRAADDFGNTYVENLQGSLNGITGWQTDIESNYLGNPTTYKAILPATNNVSFSASDKTMTITAGGGDLTYHIADDIKSNSWIDIYNHANHANNHTYSSEIINSSTINLYLKTAPVDVSAQSSNTEGGLNNTFYIENQIIKNGHLSHSTFEDKEQDLSTTRSSNSSSTTQDYNEYVVNHWKGFSITPQAVSSAAYTENQFSAYRGSLNIPDPIIEKVQTGGVALARYNGNPYSAGTSNFDASTGGYIKLTNKVATTETTTLDDDLSILATATSLYVTSSTDIYKGDYLKLQDSDEILFVSNIQNNKVTVKRGQLSTSLSAHLSGAKVYKMRLPYISQIIDKYRLNNGSNYTLQWTCKEIVDGCKGDIRISFGGGYLNQNGIWESSDDLSSGLAWISMNNYADYAAEGYEGSGDWDIFDSNWRLFGKSFSLPKAVSIEDGVTIEFRNSGKDTSALAIDDIQVRLTPVIYNNNKNIATITASGLLKNKTKRELVYYDGISNKIGLITDFGDPLLGHANEEDNSIFPKDVTSSVNSVAIIAKNKEVHLGFGPEKSDTTPKWLGYLNHKYFGEDLRGELFYGDDAIPAYESGEGISAFSKIVPAGEHMMIPVDSQSDGSIRVYHDTDYDCNEDYGDIGVTEGLNIVVREWGDISHAWNGRGVWVVTSTSTDYFTIKRKDSDADVGVLFPAATAVDAVHPSTGTMGSMSGVSISTGPYGGSLNSALSNGGYISWRPHYFYGFKRGSNRIFRITPKTWSNSDLSALSTDYIAGRIDGSNMLPYDMSSICTCYNTGSALYVYDLFTKSLIKLSVGKAFDKWEDGSLAELTNHSLEYYSFPFNNLLSETDDAVPIDTPVGTDISDILETCGTTHEYRYAYHNGSSQHLNRADYLDTRIWVQFYPASGEDQEFYFTNGDRYVFCGKTERTDNVGKTIFLADRTPPTEEKQPISTASVRRGKHIEWPIYNNKKNDSWNNAIVHNPIMIWPYKNRDHMEHFKFLKTSSGDKKEQGDYTEWKKRPKLQNFGGNIGWHSTSENKAKIKVARFGLVAMGDNDQDGIIDGTGLFVNNYENGPANPGSNKSTWYGTKGIWGQSLSSHCIGILSDSSSLWWLSGGKAVNHRFSGGLFRSAKNRAYVGSGNRLCQDDPQAVKVGPCLMTVSDINRGSSLQPELTIDSIAASTYSLNGTAFTDLLEIEVTTDHGLDIGDFVYIDGTITDGGASKVGTYSIIGIKDDKTIIINYTVTGLLVVSSGKVYSTTWDNNEKNFGHAGARFGEGYEYRTNPEDPDDGSIFKLGAWGLRWYPEPSNVRFTGSYLSTTSYRDINNNPYTITVNINQSNGIGPESQVLSDRLSFRHGWTIKPLGDKTIIDGEPSGTFSDFEIGFQSMAGNSVFPEPIYNRGSDSASYIYNSRASKIFVTTPVKKGQSLTAQEEFSNLWILDPNFISFDTSKYDRREKGWKTRKSDRGFGTNLPMAVFDVTSHSASSTEPKIVVTAALTHPLHGKYYGNIVSSTMTGKIGMQKNELAGLYCTLVDKLGFCQTRKIIGNVHDNSAKTITFSLLGDFIHTPHADDNLILWKPNQMALTPLRRYQQFKDTAESGGIEMFQAGVSHAAANQLGQAYSVSNKITALAVATNVATLTTQREHGLVVNDHFTVTGTSANDGTHKVVKVNTSRQFTYSITTSDITESLDDSSVLAASGIETAVSNPREVRVGGLGVVPMFGDLDLSQTYNQATITTATTDIVDASGHSVIHFGDETIFSNNQDVTVTLAAFDPDATADASEDAGANGTYELYDREDAATADNKAKILFDQGANETTDHLVRTDKWGLLAFSKSGPTRLGNIRAGLTKWDKGAEAGNTIRKDFSNEDREGSDTQYLVNIENQVFVKPTGSKDATGNFFRKNSTYFYKISFIYDGYQEGPLSSTTWTYENASTYPRLSLTVEIEKPNKRITHVCLYRKDYKADYYRLVKELSTQTTWTQSDNLYRRTVMDTGLQGATYESRTGYSELIEHPSIKYGISAEIDGYLFAGNCSHPEMEDASNVVFRSKPGSYSLFDWTSDFFQLPSRPTAMVGFSGRLYVFDENNTYRVNPHTLQTEDVFEGIGCSGQDSLIVTEYGMFYANRSGAYFHTGAAPKPISSIIKKDGGTDFLSVSNSSVSGSNSVPDLSWDQTAGRPDNMIPKVTFDPKRNAVLFIVESKESTGSKYYALVFSIQRARWDIWEVSQDEPSKPIMGQNGEIFIGISNIIVNYNSTTTKRLGTWLSKKLTGNMSTQDKIFKTLKIIGPSQDLNIKSSDPKLIVATDAGDISSTNLELKNTGNNNVDYNLKGSNRKAKWVQFKFEKIKDDIESVGFVFRRRSVK